MELRVGIIVASVREGRRGEAFARWILGLVADRPEVKVELRMVPVRDEVNVKLVGFEADERGRPRDPAYAKKAEAMIDDLLWWARVARQGRES